MYEEDEEVTVKNNDNDEKKNMRKKKINLPLLTPLSDDVTLESMSVWTARLSSEIQPDIAIAFIRSNVWPGAIAFAKDK